jgi:hypothetical protein
MGPGSRVRRTIAGSERVLWPQALLCDLSQVHGRPSTQVDWMIIVACGGRGWCEEWYPRTSISHSACPVTNAYVSLSPSSGKGILIDKDVLVVKASSKSAFL